MSSSCNNLCEDLKTYKKVFTQVDDEYWGKEGINGLGYDLDDDNLPSFMFFVEENVIIPPVLYDEYRTKVMFLEK